jgi:AcrR family transcriptional regulator
MSSSPPPLQRRPEAERQQIHVALIAVCGERGLGKATSEQVIERAGVDDAAFARHFADLDDCFAQYIVDVRDLLTERMETAAAATQDWRRQLRSVVCEMVRFLHADRARGQMLLVETLAAGPRGSLVREQSLERMVDLIDRGRRLMDEPETLTRVTAEAMTGALFNQMHQLQDSGDLADPCRLVPQLMYFLVLPYLGQQAALEELSLPPTG